MVEGQHWVEGSGRRRRASLTVIKPLATTCLRRLGMVCERPQETRDSIPSRCRTVGGGARSSPARMLARFATRTLASDHRCVARDSRLGQMANMRRELGPRIAEHARRRELSRTGASLACPFNAFGGYHAEETHAFRSRERADGVGRHGAGVAAGGGPAESGRAEADAARLMRRSSLRRRVRISGCFRSSRAPTCSDRTMHRSATSTTSCSTSRARSWVYRRRRLPRHRREERRHRHEAFKVVPASTGSTAGSAAPMGSDDPTNVKLKVTWTKEQLKNAPTSSTTSRRHVRRPRWAASDYRHGAAAADAAHGAAPYRWRDGDG